MSADPRDDAPPIMDTRRQRRYEPPPHYGARVVPVELHEISLAHFAIKYLKLLWLHILVAGACFALAHHYIGTQPVKYRALAKLVYQEDLAAGPQSSGGGGSAIEMLLSPGGSSSQVAQIMAMTKLRSFLIPLIENRNLLPLIFAELWQEPGKSGTWRRTEAGIPDVDGGYGRLAGSIFFKSDADTDIIDYGVAAPTPAASLELTRIVLEEFNRAYRRDKTSESERTKDFIERELERTSNLDLRELLLGLYQQQLRQQILMTVQPDVPFKVVDEAIAPGGPFSPNKRLIYMVAAAAALALSLFTTMVWPGRWSLRRRAPR